MLIALLAVLGVDLITIVALIALVVARRRWLKRQPGEFVGAVRVSRGEIDGLSPKWKRGSGRWVRNVLVWSQGSLRLRNCLVPVDRLSAQRQAKAGEVKRLGDSPVVCEFESNGAAIEIAGKADHAALVAGALHNRPRTRSASDSSGIRLVNATVTRNDATNTQRERS